MTRSRRTTIGAAAALALGVLAGCGGGATAPADTPSPDAPLSASSPAASSSAATGSSASPSALPAADPAAAAGLRRAVRAVRSAGSGTYVVRIRIGTARILDRGRYRISPLAFDYTRWARATPTGAAVPTELLGTGGRVWLRVGSGRAGRCWMSPSRAVVRQLGTVGLPAAVSALEGAHGLSGTGARIIGTVPLSQVASLAGAGTLQRLAIPTDSRTPTRATFTVRHGRVVAWSSSLAAIVDAMARQGLPAPTGLTGADTMALRVRLADLGTPQTVSAPAAARVVSMDQPQRRFKAAMRACEGPR